MSERAPSSGTKLFKVGTLFGEHLGCRALEAIDRLLLVADCEKRPYGFLRPFSGEELTCQRFDDSPLLRGSVLRLGYQNMVEAAIQRLTDPVRRLR